MKKAALLGMGLSLLLVTLTNCGKNQVPVDSGDVSTPELERIVLSADLWRQEIPPEALETKKLVESTDVPRRDLVRLTSQIKGPGQIVSREARDKPWAFALGENHEFWVQNRDTEQYDRVKANLAYETPHTYWFVAERLNLDPDSLAKSAERFEQEIYPTNHHFFGEEWSPGVDNDPHLVILLTGGLGEGIGAYQNSLDEYTQAVNPFSNEMEMIYVSDDISNSTAFDCTIAHEFQHVIQWAVDRDEKTWLNEVFSLLACPLNDLEAEYADFIVEAFVSEPDTPLNVWRLDSDQAAAQYGASYLFGSYLMDQLGEEAVTVLAADPANGLASVDSILVSLGTGLDADQLFADWLAANYLNDPSLDGGRYGYRDIDLPQLAIEAQYEADSLPAEIRGTVDQYAADYISLTGEGQFQIDFAGSTLVRLAEVEAHSGLYVWWGGREQESDASVSKYYDLTGLTQATLTFYTWYDIDEGHDYAYVLASTDGQHWIPLTGQAMAIGNPNGVNFGPGYTGRSGSWIQEQIDLTPFAGQEILIRFQYLTDDGPTGPGFFLDDIAIPELGYQYDAESGTDGWEASGFMRLANLLPQEWALQLLIQQDDQPMVERLQLDPDNQGRWLVTLEPGESAVLVVAGIARGTAERADYWVRLSAQSE